ncbi:MAG: Gfo/Idh/MocA family oxidoreductase [Clostridia bacterium]|nr:Gfo/Idh/MocA family oxidoreductase [Clostridia bacterium]
MSALFRVAVVGCGAICGNHITAISEAGQTLCALCDIEHEQAQRVAVKFGLGNIPIYTDYQTLLDTEHPDAVHICTPHDLHAPMTVMALEQNIHVLCEKPLCISLEQLHALHVAVNNSKAQLGVCHQNRYEPNMLRLREMAAGNVKAAFGSVVWHRDAAYYRSAAWRGTWEREGGGVMINQALHTLDLMQWICGCPSYVTAHVFNDSLQDVIEVEDTASACFECDNGIRFHFFATNAAIDNLPVQIRVQLRSGDLIEAQNQQLCFNHKEVSSYDHIPTVGKAVWGKGHRSLIRDFYSCLEEGMHFPIDLAEGEKVIRLILAMYMSNGKRVAVPK